MAAQIETVEQENIKLLRRRSEILDMLVEYQKVRGLTDTEIKAFEQLNKIEQSIPELFVQVEHLRGRSKVGRSYCMLFFPGKATEDFGVRARNMLWAARQLGRLLLPFKFIAITGPGTAAYAFQCQQVCGTKSAGPRRRIAGAESLSNSKRVAECY